MEEFSASLGSLSLDGTGNTRGKSKGFNESTVSCLGRNGASLSMKMRSEATKLSQPSPLPPVTRSRQPKNIHEPKVIPKSEVLRMYERLSGQYESEGFEAYPDRSIIHHPTTFCVRCSDHASICMPCADDLKNKAVTFFRKSQALGAYHLLNGAIHQAGCEKTLRSMIFYLWKNYIKDEAIQRKIREEKSKRKYAFHLMIPTFNAWVSLAKSLIKDKRNRKNFEYEERIKTLEALVQKLNTEKNVMELQAKRTQKSLDKCLLENEEKCATIKKLTDTLYDDQYRVLKLSNFVHSITPPLFGMLNRNAKGVSQATTKHAQFCKNISAVSMNYAKVMKPNKSSVEAPVSTGPTSWSEKSPQLVAWVNYTSKNANMMKHGAGEDEIELDKFLPPFRDIKKLTELRNGQQLCRIAVKLTLHIMKEKISVPKPPPPRKQDNPGPLVPSGPPPQSAKVNESLEPAFVFTREHAQDIKENVAVASNLLRITHMLMINALKCPELSIEQIESGDPVALEALVGSLMLISSNHITGEIPADEKADLQKFSGVVEAMRNEIDKNITKAVPSHMLTFPEELFRDEEKEKRLEEERQQALANKDKLRKEKRAADKAAREQARKRSRGESVGDETDSLGQDSIEEVINKEDDVAESKEKRPRTPNVNSNPRVEFVDSFAEQYQDITQIIDDYFGNKNDEKLNNLSACISTLEEELKRLTDQMGVMLRKERTALGNVQFSIHTNNEIALSNTSRMLPFINSRQA